jgi:peptide/nickel transport system substrate-binding protein
MECPAPPGAPATRPLPNPALQANTTPPKSGTNRWRSRIDTILAGSRGRAPGLAVLLALLLLTLPAVAQRPLRIVLGQELAILDPIISTNNATRQFGYMVFDTLIAMDSMGQYRPQMLEGWTVSEDGLRYVFRLREGLEWHDGAPVTAADCVASLRRWGARDGLGQLLMAATASLVADDARQFTLTLSRPFGFVIEALGKPGTIVPFMMPERLAATDPMRPVSEIIGSGPFTFRREEWRQGDRAVFRRFARYRPREEPADGLAGGKVVHFEVAEFVSITDPATRAAALQAGEVDYLEFLSPDYIPSMRRNRNVIVMQPSGGMGQYMPFITLNHAIPPFNNPRIRQAAQAALDQSEIMAAMGLPADLYVPDCTSILTCNSPSFIPATHPNLALRGVERARTLLREAGYANERVIFMHPTDSVNLSPVASMAMQQLRRAGFNVEEYASDWATVAARRLNREPIERGGWNAMPLIWPGVDLFSPIVFAGTAFNCRAYPGWFCDEPMRDLLVTYTETRDPARRRELATAIQDRFHENVNLIIAGQMSVPQAHRADLQGVVPFAFPIPWGLRRAAR